MKGYDGVGGAEAAQQVVDDRYRDWAGLADDYIGALYGQPAHKLRGSEPQFVSQAVLPRGGYGPRVSPEIAALRTVVQLGPRYLRERLLWPNVTTAKWTWLRALKLAPKPCPSGWSTRRAAIRFWPQLGESEIKAGLDIWAAEVLRAEDSITASRKRQWDEWVRRAFAEDASSKVYRFIRGPRCPLRASCQAPCRG